MEVIIDFSNKTVVVTGGASGIGKTICDEFKKYGANVCVIDKRENDYFTGDIADENTLRSFTQKVIGDYKSIDYLINNAMLSEGGIFNCSYDDFNYILRVGLPLLYVIKAFYESF